MSWGWDASKLPCPTCGHVEGTLGTTVEGCNPIRPGSPPEWALRLWPHWMVEIPRRNSASIGPEWIHVANVSEPGDLRQIALLIADITRCYPCEADTPLPVAWPVEPGAMIFDRGEEILYWGKETYSARSGPHGKGALPPGRYTIRVRHCVEGSHLAVGFEAASGKRWFIPLGDDVPDRGGFGIHPDGGVPGTLGCVGLDRLDADFFWTRWNRTPMNERPAWLDVV